MFSYAIDNPRSLTLTRKGQYIKVAGWIRSRLPEAKLGDIHICVGRRRVKCEVVEDKDGGTSGREWRFAAMYRVGRGLIRLRLVFFDVNNDREVILGDRFVWAGAEWIGPAVRIAKKGDTLLDGLNLVGPLQYELGLGESARGLYHSAEAAGVSVTPFGIPLTLNAPPAADFDRRLLGRRLERKITVFHVNPPEMRAVKKHWPGVLANGQYNVGYWYFELSRLPNSWRDGFQGLREVWVASRFVADAVSAISPIPVHIVPPLVSVVASSPLSRDEFRLPAEAVCVLFVFDLNSYRARKNPDAVIAAFRYAVAAEPRLHLVLKINNADKNWEAMADLRRALADLNPVTLITEVYSRATLTRLQLACDIFISLHRAEGFGLNLAECMALGKPVVATAWSANMDFMDSANSCLVGYDMVELTESFGPYEKGQIWAEARIADAVSHLVRLARSPDLRRSIGLQGQRTIESRYSMAAVGSAVKARLSAIERGL